MALVLNCGSSSVKWQLIEATSGEKRAGGVTERVTLDGAGLVDNRDALATILADVTDVPVSFVGHRVVHGGTAFVEPTVITDEVVAHLERLSVFAPMHNPANLAGIRAARAAFPGVPHIAVFDTAFHQTIPPSAYSYAIDREVAATHGVRRFGFHGISFQYVSRTAAELLETRPASLRLILFHLGNGASACAVRGGISIDTSMGLTPMPGLVMGSRPGDIDPGALLHLMRRGMTLDEVDDLLNHRSGLKGMCGQGDFRDVTAAAQMGVAEARLAIDVMQHRLKHYLGAYLALLGGADAIVFTGGVGENSAAIRSATVSGLEPLGIVIDEARNSVHDPIVSAATSRTAILVVATNEELEIARQSLGVFELMRTPGRASDAR